MKLVIRFFGSKASEPVRYHKVCGHRYLVETVNYFLFLLSNSCQLKVMKKRLFWRRRVRKRRERRRERRGEGKRQKRGEERRGQVMVMKSY